MCGSYYTLFWPIINLGRLGSKMLYMYIYLLCSSSVTGWCEAGRKTGVESSGTVLGLAARLVGLSSSRRLMEP